MVILMNYLSVDPIDPKIGIYVEHATPIQKQLLVRDVSIVDAANLVGYGVGVEGVGVDGIDGDCDDNEIDVENGDVDEVDVEDGHMGMVLWEMWIMSGMTLTMMTQPMNNYMKLLWMTTQFSPP